MAGPEAIAAVAAVAAAFLARRPAPAAALLERYAAELARWNRGASLVSRRLDRAALDGLIVDSLAVAAALPADAVRVADVGSGAGLPGIVVACVRPDLELHLIERRRKRAAFLAHARDHLGLTRVTVHAADARALAADPAFAAGFDVALARALARPAAALALAGPLVRPGGLVLIATGAAPELASLGRVIPAAALVPGARGALIEAPAPGTYLSC